MYNNNVIKTYVAHIKTHGRQMNVPVNSSKYNGVDASNASYLRPKVYVENDEEDEEENDLVEITNNERNKALKLVKKAASKASDSRRLPEIQNPTRRSEAPVGRNRPESEPAQQALPRIIKNNSTSADSAAQSVSVPTSSPVKGKISAMRESQGQSQTQAKAASQDGLLYSNSYEEEKTAASSPSSNRANLANISSTPKPKPTAEPGLAPEPEPEPSKLKASSDSSFSVLSSPNDIDFIKSKLVLLEEKLTLQRQVR
jgi:hypothetical protein